MNTPERKKYPQLWWYNSRLYQKNKSMALLWRWLCEKILGHELSNTEHGSGGGRYVDHWCRWCNKLIEIPIEESIWAEDNKDMLNLVQKSKDE